MNTTTNPIVNGSVVKYQDRYYRVTARFKETVNLGGIFGGPIQHRKVAIFKVQEAHDEWYKKWQESETYQSM